jgi:Uncharacterised nucleotidyltransferase
VSSGARVDDASGPVEGASAGRRLEDPLAEALRLIAAANEAKLQVRLLGGLAFHAKVPTWTARINREGRDIDLATRSKDKRALASLLVAEGYEPDKGYNAVHGYKQLYFSDPVSGRPIDVIIDRLDMCHEVFFRNRLLADYPTLPLAELLLSKLQIVKINKKDILDVVVLLGEYPLAEHDEGAINTRPVIEACAGDWGWWRTLTGNLARICEYCKEELSPADVDVGHAPAHDSLAQLGRLRELVDGAPKPVKWKMRARIGERVTWYKEPEEVGHEAL